MRGLIAIAVLNPTIAYAGVAAAFALGLPQEPNANGTSRCGVSDYAALAALPRGLALNTIDTGPFILAFSPMSAVAAPYHRNVDGLMAQIEAFRGSAETARAVALSRRAAYVVACPTDGGFATTARDFPNSLSAALMSGRPPAWLTPVDLRPGAALMVYRVTP